MGFFKNHFKGVKQEVSGLFMKNTKISQSINNNTSCQSITMETVDDSTIIEINGHRHLIKGNNIVIDCDRVYADGKEVVFSSADNINPVIEKIVIEGSTIANIRSNMNIEVHGDVNCNKIDAGGHVNITGSVSGDIEACRGISIAGSLKGDADAGTDINIGTYVDGDVDAGRNVTANGDIHGDVMAGRYAKCSNRRDI